MKLPRSFYLRNTTTVARYLLGKYLVRRLGNQRLIGRIVEVEAYLGSRDPASHAYRGRTRRNDVMFWVGGHLYVYFTYGMHFCANVVTCEKGIAHAVLIRALEPVAGLEIMRRNRGRAAARDLCNGPAKLCQALSIRRAENGTDLCGLSIWIAARAGRAKKLKVSRSTRVGITSGREHRWRFYLPESPFVSPGKPS